jgi:hypothetical protein
MYLVYCQLYMCFRSQDIIDNDCFVLNKARRIAFGIEERNMLAWENKLP